MKQLGKNLIATADDNGRVNLFDLRNNQLVLDVYEQKNGTITQFEFANQNLLIASSTEGTLGFYDLRKIEQKDKLFSFIDQEEGELNCLVLTEVRLTE